MHHCYVLLYFTCRCYGLLASQRLQRRVSTPGETARAHCVVAMAALLYIATTGGPAHTLTAYPDCVAALAALKVPPGGVYLPMWTSVTSCLDVISGGFW
jgi:hypothetical protein